MRFSYYYSATSALVLVAALVSQPAHADDTQSAPQEASSTENTNSGAIADIVVTGLKRSTQTSVAKAPLAISAFGPEQLAQAHVVNVAQVQTQIPNVYFNKASTSPGQNQFTIRGMGVYGSQPGSTPTTGIFVDEVYQASTVGAILPSFDIASIEVLRGPQGLLFGQNVTAGAILIRTNQPSDTLHVDARAAIETGPEYRMSAVITGPLTETIAGKIAAFYDKDEGWFNQAAPLKGALGRSETLIGRAALTFGMNMPFSVTPRIEQTRIRGQGGVSQNQLVFGDSFRTRLDHPGRFDMDMTQASIDANWDVGPGKLFNQVAFRRYVVRNDTDVDGTELPLYVQTQNVRYRQFSEELRYAGTIGPVDFTVGGYYFTDRLYVTHRTDLATAVPAQNLGGSVQKSELVAGFASADITLFEGFKLNLGARYSWEKKDVKIKAASNVLTTANPCDLEAIRCTAFDRIDGDSWTAFTPKIGFQYQPTDSTNIYGYFTKGFRSGGYNLRVSSPTTDPGPYDQEVAKTFEIGIKQSLLDRKLNISVALFTTKFDNLQRDILIPDPVFGFVQTSTNAADARIRGFEAEVYAKPVSWLTIGGNVGYLDDKFLKFHYDVLGNGGTTTISPANYDLKIPFLLPWTYSVYGNFERETSIGLLSGRVAYSYRQKGFSNDRNTGTVSEAHDLEANLTWTPASAPRWQLSIYGRNLLNDVTFGYSNPAAVAGIPFTASVLNEGRVIGGEVSYKF